LEESVVVLKHDIKYGLRRIVEMKGLPQTKHGLLINEKSNCKLIFLSKKSSCELFDLSRKPFYKLKERNKKGK
jgi:hypothetical protein